MFLFAKQGSNLGVPLEQVLYGRRDMCDEKLDFPPCSTLPLCILVHE